MIGLDANGSIAWERIYWGHGQSLTGIVECSNGDNLAVGEWSSWSDGMYMLRIDSSENSVCERGQVGHPTTIAQASEKTYVVAGHTDGPRHYLVGLKEATPEGFTDLLPLLIVIIYLRIEQPHRRQTAWSMGNRTVSSSPWA